MGRIEFCRSHEMAVSTLARHLKKQRSKQIQTDGNVIERSHLVAVELSTPAPFVRCADVSATLIVLLPNNRRVEVGRGFDQDTLAQLLTVLEKL